MTSPAYESPAYSPADVAAVLLAPERDAASSSAVGLSAATVGAGGTDRGADFATLFATYFEPLVARAERVLSCPHRAQEVVLDVFTKYWRQRAEIDVHTSVEAYLKTSVSNRAVDYLRKRRRERAFTGELPRHRVCGDALPDSLAHASGLGARIEEAIAALPPRGQEMFRLNRFEGLTYQQIAERCDVSYKTVETHIRRSLIALRNRLQPFVDQEL